VWLKAKAEEEEYGYGIKRKNSSLKQRGNRKIGVNREGLACLEGPTDLCRIFIVRRKENAYVQHKTYG